MSAAAAPHHQRAAALAALAGLGLTLALFWPGYLSFDGAYQWWQARHGEFTTQHPPLMSLLWAASERVVSGPGPLWLLFLSMYWAALALLVPLRPRPAWLQSVGVLVIGLWPPLLALNAHVWKDVGMMAALALAVAALARRQAGGGRRWLALALAALVFAACMRHNAIVAVLPLAWWWGQTEARWRRRAARTLGLTVLVMALAALPNCWPGMKRESLWPTVALWDLAALSVREDRMLIPPRLTHPDNSPQALAPHILPWTNTPLFAHGGVKLNLIVPYDEEDFRALRRAWLDAVLKHPGSYLRHRALVTAYLFGYDRAGLPDYVVLVPGVVAFRDNPPLTFLTDAPRKATQARLDALVDTPLFAGWPYLLLALAVLATGWRRPERLAATATAASALLYVAPLPLITGSAEFRYLSWLLLGSLLALLLPAAPGATPRSKAGVVLRNGWGTQPGRSP